MKYKLIQFLIRDLAEMPLSKNHTQKYILYAALNITTRLSSIAANLKKAEHELASSNIRKRTLYSMKLYQAAMSTSTACYIHADRNKISAGHYLKKETRWKQR